VVAALRAFLLREAAAVPEPAAPDYKTKA